MLLETVIAIIGAAALVGFGFVVYKMLNHEEIAAIDKVEPPVVTETKKKAPVKKTVAKTKTATQKKPATKKTAAKKATRSKV